jgi:ubiquinone biosynthesis protein Coq4
MVTIDLEALLQLPEHTLGGAYAREMVQQGFDPKTFVDQGDSWVSRRMALAHDVHHTLTGFDHSGPGEMGLAAFEFLQSWDLLNAFVLSHTPWALLGNSPRVASLIGRGLWLGLKAKPLFGYPYEQNWEKPVAEVRRELGLPF